jgi:hypothetical protein
MPKQERQIKLDFSILGIIVILIWHLALDMMACVKMKLRINIYSFHNIIFPMHNMI